MLVTPGLVPAAFLLTLWFAVRSCDDPVPAGLLFRREFPHALAELSAEE
jgi:hypothetical protein